MTPDEARSLDVGDILHCVVSGLDGFWQGCDYDIVRRVNMGDPLVVNGCGNEVAIYGSLLSYFVVRREPVEAATHTHPQASGQFASSVLSEAANIVGGARNTTHGDKERSFAAIAGLWNAYLAARKTGGEITPRDVAWMMTLLKIGRSVQGQSIRDHYVDAAGYAAIAGECGDVS